MSILGDVRREGGVGPNRCVRLMPGRSERAVLVIGGGVAGSACAIRLRQQGVKVTIAEKALFPRNKVCGCCIGGNGLAALEKLSLNNWAIDSGVITSVWKASLGSQLVEVPLPDGIAISRQLLDTKLLERASAVGAKCERQCKASLVSMQHDFVTARLETVDGVSEHEFSVVVIASGLNSGGYQDILPWNERPHGPFGVSWTAESDHLQTGVIYMACDDDGYVGAVRLEDGRVDIAAALISGSGSAKRGTPVDRVESILSRSEFPDWSLVDRSPMLTTPPLRRSRLAGNRRVLAIGDAAGYVEPFTGEGMTWGLQTGIAAADRIASASPQGLAVVGDHWNQQLHGLLKSKRRSCRVVTSVLRSPIARWAAGQSLARWPGLANPIIRKLNSEPSRSDHVRSD